MMTVIAHGSGVDDVLWFLVPVVIAMLILRRVEKKAARKGAQDSDAREGD